jgi:hypothetical protein
MSLKKEIAATRISVNRAVVKSKLGKLISDQILNPILNSLDNRADEIAHDIGMFIVDHLKDLIQSSSPSGRTYEIVVVSPDGDKNTYTSIGSYTASAPGQPPASFPGPHGIPSGTLLESINFEVTGNGNVLVGIFDSTGTEITTLFYRGGKIFISEGMDEGSTTDVTYYSNLLDEHRNRPWFREPMEKLRPQIREILRRKMRAALNRSTRSKGRKGIYFRVYFRQKNLLYPDDEGEE